jgi:DsbC/DsbD-like thiol-disulfide interchange protein
MICSRFAAQTLFLPLLTAGVLLGANTPQASAQPKESKDAVKIAATADTPDADGKQNVTMAIDIQAGWHLYANPVNNQDMVSSQTVVKIAAGGKLEDVKITYPAGKTKKDTAGNYDIYEGKIVIKATVKRAKDDTSPLDISVMLSACDENKCLLPSTVKVKADSK